MKTALITGCNGGLGQTLLKKFASQGYDILACGYPYDEGFIKECGDIAAEYAVSIKTIFFDVTNNEELETGLAKISEYEGEIDLLVNNAGINIMKPTLFTELSDLEKTFRINYFAPVLIAKAVVEKMVRQGSGVIVNITSIGSMSHQTGGSCYDASKAALNQFTVSAAQEVAPFGIRVNAVACGPMNSPMFAGLPEKAQKNLIKSVAFKRLVETSEIADVVSFLASDQSGFITGEIIKVDGGAII